MILSIRSWDLVKYYCRHTEKYKELSKFWAFVNISVCFGKCFSGNWQARSFWEWIWSWLSQSGKVRQPPTHTHHGHPNQRQRRQRQRTQRQWKQRQWRQPQWQWSQRQLTMKQRKRMCACLPIHSCHGHPSRVHFKASSTVTAVKTEAWGLFAMVEMVWLDLWQRLMSTQNARSLIENCGLWRRE